MRTSMTIWLPVMAIGMTAVAVRSFNLSTTPLWTDELFTRFYPDAGLSYLWGQGFQAEPTAPLYYTLIWATERVFGSEAWALRAPSMAGSLVSIALAWKLGRELFERPHAAALGALLLSVAPTHVFYAQEARSYALQGAALTWALLGFARMLRGAPGLVAYAGGIVLATWLHPTSVVACLAFNVTALAATLGSRRLLSRSALLRWIGANVLVLVACSPLLPALLWPPGGGAAIDWIPGLTRWSLESVVGETLAGPAMLGQAQRVAEAGLLLAALSFIPPWRPGARAFLVLVLVPGLTLGVMIGVSAFKPILLARTLAWLLIPLAVALGGILSRRPVAVGLCVVAMAVAGLVNQIEQAPVLKEDWPGLFAKMPDLAAPTLLILAPRSPPGAVAVYAPAFVQPVRLDDGRPAVPETSIMPLLFGTVTITRAQLVSAIEAGRPVWLVYRRPEYDWVQGEIAGLPAPKRTIQSEPGSNPALRALQW